MPRTATVEERREAAQRVLEAEIRRIVDSGEYAEWFGKLARFHRYSPTNTMWILAQRPDATRVASYRTWQELGRQVRRGETGIMVFHPKPYWVDPATGDRVRPPRTNHDRARLERRVGFGVGHVFDVSQTGGEPLPELGRPAPEDAPQALAEHLHNYCVDNHINVETRRLPDGLSGYYQRGTDLIVLDESLSPGAALATLAHELAHREDPELIAAHVIGDRNYYTHHRPDCEAVAEAAAHTISARFGHDITGRSAGYIASWIDGDVDRFTHLHDRVGQVARALVPPDQLDLALDAAHLKVVQQREVSTAPRRR